MKILALSTIYEYGGVSKIVKNIIDNLDREKFEVVFLVERLASMHYPLRKDMKFINLDLKPAKGPIRKLVNIFSHLYQIRKAILYENPDIVLSFTFALNCFCLLAFLWPAKLRPKIILAEYTEELFVEPKEKTFKQNIFRCIYRLIMFFLYHRADRIVSVSNSLVKRIKKCSLIDSKKIAVIHVPVNIEEVRILSRDEGYSTDENVRYKACIGTVARLSVEKGVNYLIEAFSDLIKRIDARLLIVGDGEERGRLEEMVRDLHIEDKVSFLGWLENPYSYLRKMDVFVLSSLYEGFPNVILESMVCGVPVVATRCVGAIEEVIEDGVHGLLVPPKDTKALSASMYRLLQDQGLRTRLVMEANNKIGQFDATRIAKRFESLMLDLNHED